MPNHMGLSDSVLTSVALSGRSISAVANGVAIDTQQYGAARFVINIGTVTTALDGLIQTAPDSGFNTVTNVALSNLTQITNANGIAIIEIWHPTSRYVRLQLTGTNAAVVAASVDQYNRDGILPPTQSAVQYIKIAQN